MRPAQVGVHVPPGLLVVLALAALVAGESGCGNSAAQAPRGGARQDRVAVKTLPIQRITVRRQVEVSGTLVSPDQARVSSEAAGVVRAVPVQLGTEVRPGDVLARLDPQEASLALERAESALRQTEAQLGVSGDNAPPPPPEQIASVRNAEATRDDARATLARVERLVSRGLLASVELDNARTRLKVAETAYQSALDNARAMSASLQDRRASHTLARKKVGDTAIRAPIAGFVSERLVQPGEFITQNTPVVTVVQVDPLKLRTSVQERYAAQITPGLRVTFRVESFPGVEFVGKVAYVSPAIDQATRTFQIEALVDNRDRRLKPGFFAKGVIETRVDADVLAVPDQAVSTLAGVSAVFVIDNGKVRQQPVTLGVKQGAVFEVTEGLKGDEVLAASNLNQLATGTAVVVDDGSRPAREAGPGPAEGARARGDGR